MQDIQGHRLVDTHCPSQIECTAIRLAFRHLSTVTRRHEIWCDCDWCTARLLIDPFTGALEPVRCRLSAGADE